jgi:uncharacterized membrane protein YfcA
MSWRHPGRIYSAAPSAQIRISEQQRNGTMRALIALIIVPTVIAAVIAGSRLLAQVTGDMMSAVMLELIVFVTIVAVFCREPRSAQRALSRKHGAGRATLS